MHSKVTPNRKLRGAACVQYHVLPPPATRGACELLLPVHVPIGVAHLHGLAVGDRNGALRDEQRLLRHEGMPECSRGLRVRPFRGGGALFYHKRGDGANDELSSHGGCPPLPSATADDEVVAWKINGVMWNTDSDRGPRYFRS